MRSLLVTMAMLGLALIFNHPAWTQTTAQQAPSTDLGNMDAQLVQCLLIDNQSEVKLSEFAGDRANRDQVKAFAKQMKEDHQQLMQRLSQVSSVNLQSEGHAGTASAPHSATFQDGKYVGRVPSQAGDMIQLKKEVAAECGKAIRAELESKSGDEFDRCYLGQQVGAHMHMLAGLKVFERHASPQLKPVIDDSIQMTEGHLRKAKQLLQGVESEVAQAKSTDGRR